MSGNYYEILGLDRDATDDDVRRAYRRLALQFHPDRSDAPDAEERFQAINEAHQVLSGASTRIDYDRCIEQQEQEAERRQREAEDRRQSEERAHRAAEERRRQAEAERSRREEAERQQRRAEERRQREERVRRAAEERHRSQAEERLRESAGQPEEAVPHEGLGPEGNVEVVPTALVVAQRPPASAPPVAARNARVAGVVIASSVVALLALAAGILGVVYLLLPTTATPDPVFQPTPDLGATITAAVAAAWPTPSPPVQPAEHNPPNTAPTTTLTVQADDGNGGTDTATVNVTVTDVAEAPPVGPLSGFTLVDASDQSALATLTDGASVALADPSVGSYGIRADLADDESVGSVKLELSGTKTVTQTENITPYSLYGDSNEGDESELNGEALPAGSYTLRATAYSESKLGGDELGALEVSFTITAQ